MTGELRSNAIILDFVEKPIKISDLTELQLKVITANLEHMLNQIKRYEEGFLKDDAVIGTNSLRMSKGEFLLTEDQIEKMLMKTKEMVDEEKSKL